MKQKINLRLGLIALVALILTTVGVTKVYYDLFRQQVGRQPQIPEPFPTTQTGRKSGRPWTPARGRSSAPRIPSI